MYKLATIKKQLQFSVICHDQIYANEVNHIRMMWDHESLLKMSNVWKCLPEMES